MRSKEATDQYQRMVAGMVKDIAFHQLFVRLQWMQMEQFRQENALNSLFDHNMAFDILDSMHSQKISAYELQGFLRYDTSLHSQQGYDFEEEICQQVVRSLDKSLVHLNKATYHSFQSRFIEMVLPRSQQLRSECNYKFDRVPVSVNDFEFWRRVRNETSLKLCQCLVRECHFYSELSKRRKQFCHQFYGDIYTLTNIFAQRETLGYQNLHDWLKQLKVLLNPEQYKALLRRAKYFSGQKKQQGTDQLLTKEELVELVVTNNLSLKDSRPIKFQSQTGLSYDPGNFSYYQRKKREEDTASTSYSLGLQSRIETVEKPELSYKFAYPQAQLTTTGNLFLIGESLRTLSHTSRRRFY